MTQRAALHRGGIAALVLLLAWLIAAASRTAPLWGGARAGRADRAALFVEVGVACGVGAAIAFAMAVLVHRTRLARRPHPPPLNATLLQALPFASVALAVLALIVIASAPLDGSREARPGRALTILGSGGLLWLLDPRQPPVVENEGDADADATRQPTGRGALDPRLLLLLGAAAAAIGVALARRSRTAASAAADDEPEDEDAAPDADFDALRESMAGTIDAMLADPDARTAIIGAYARLLEGLAACNVARHAHEAPLEHLYRALVLLRVRPEPLRRLIGLFEVARFSTHPLTPAHRDAALDALRDAATDLAVAGRAVATR